MELLTRAIENDEGFKTVVNALTSGRTPVLLTGTGALPRVHTAAALRLITGRTMLVICTDEGEANKFADDIRQFLGETISRLFTRDFQFYNIEAKSLENEHARIKTLNALIEGSCGVLVTTPDAMMIRTMPPKTMRDMTIKLKVGKEYDLTSLSEKFVQAGYERTSQVEGAGQFSIRGGILDIFSPSREDPVRCEFFGDELDTMGVFDVMTQRRVKNIDEIMILPACEVSAYSAFGGAEELEKRMTKLLKTVSRRKSAVPAFLDNVKEDIDRVKNGRTLPAADRYLDLIYEPATALDYLPEDTVILLCDPNRLSERAGNYSFQINQDILTLTEAGQTEGSAEKLIENWDSLVTRIGDYSTVMMSSFTTSRYPLPPRAAATINAKQLPGFGISLETASGDISHYRRSGYSVVVLVKDKTRCKTLSENLKRQEIPCSVDYSLKSLPPKGACVISVGELSAGLEYPSLKLAILTEGISAKKQFKRRSAKKLPSNRKKLDSFTDLSNGDLVVHEDYGIGRYAGIVTRRVDSVNKDYIKIVYAGSDTLYIPVSQLDTITKYIGAGEDTNVKLSKLGSTDWTKAKTKAKTAVKKLADDLIKLQAERQSVRGFAFSPDSPWQREFEDSFEYQETDDQLRVQEEIKADMEKPVPMDRLLCGDVGYGKTEVAFRAIMKCVLDGKQAAILVPTTVLAEQHYQTATRRFSAFPLRIDVLSRFKKAKEQKDTLAGMEDGSVDIVIGTHKLLQKRVKFKDLGLLVVDEEQRFGVTHKERLKTIAHQVDVLTLSATPIPRTLNMALSGVRDMSTIEEPPSDRLPVQTYVVEHDWGMLAEAIRREIARGGQVYYLHNRVETIEDTAGRLRQMLEGVSIAVGHGKMDEESLTTVMDGVQSGEVQVLVCTTIIETGIDIPNVNTLIIEDADRMGLSQLHQLRGRVGRSSRRAYAYFTFRKDKVMNETAQKRLEAIREFTEFNSGFKIAMRDLEIRGAGNILGAEQSGHIVNVGYDMYLKLLDEAVNEQKNGGKQTETECAVDIAVSAGIPDYYVSQEEQRMDLYRRISRIREKEDADDMLDELIDRFGNPPKETNALLRIALLRGMASGAGVKDISQKQGALIFTMTELNPNRIMRIYDKAIYKGRIKIESAQNPVVNLKLRTTDNPIDLAFGFIEDYKAVRA